MHAKDAGLITFITPSWNRGDMLERLYASLEAQTEKDFVWLIEDDGSTDTTEEVVRGIMEKASFPVRYDKKENGGKHTAVNRAMEMVATPLVMIVDSDDTLTDDAVLTISAYHRKYEADAERLKLCGYSFLRAYPDGEINGGRYPEDESIGSVADKRINAGILGDRAEVYLTSVLKQYPFPVFDGERFLPEDETWIRMSGPYDMVHINRVIYVSEYLETGLTRTGRRMKIHNPCGMMARSNAYLETRGIKPAVRVKMMLLYRIYERFYGRDRVKPEGLGQQSGLLYALMCLPSLVIYSRWSRDRG